MLQHGKVVLLGDRLVVTQNRAAEPAMANDSCELVGFVLVGCVKRRGHRASLGREIYTSTLWQHRRAYAELHGFPWYILNVMPGLLAPGVRIDPYDLLLADLSAAERRDWSQSVLGDLAAEVPVLDGKTNEVHAGKPYVAFSSEKDFRDAGVIVSRPLGHVVGLGPQGAWYREHLASCPQGG